ncbi:MAG: hypothetical protein B1H11_04160 [Desulfobacteraceae bacterium 4484_190.1]|nr:MAG: hypothetical protein B1H11_04160 [Desulfobacteraceae bacterium 4484_190.1]
MHPTVNLVTYCFTAIKYLWVKGRAKLALPDKSGCDSSHTAFVKRQSFISSSFGYCFKLLDFIPLRNYS